MNNTIFAWKHRTFHDTGLFAGILENDPFIVANVHIVVAGFFPLLFVH